jgi:hypothetical protein
MEPGLPWSPPARVGSVPDSGSLRPLALVAHQFKPPAPNRTRLRPRSDVGRAPVGHASSRQSLGRPEQHMTLGYSSTLTNCDQPATSCSSRRHDPSIKLARLTPLNICGRTGSAPVQSTANRRHTSPQTGHNQAHVPSGSFDQNSGNCHRPANPACTFSYAVERCVQLSPDHATPLATP